ncbi:MAG: hypothetical protein M1426_05740, partial [Patescibacteria group bacterium]|nr:hypothetical protein [Patescibacteria group bacterium]
LRVFGAGFFFIKGREKQIWFLIFGLAFALSTQTYSPYRLTIPMFTVFLLLWSRQLNPLTLIKKPLLFISLCIIAASAILSLFLTISRGNEDRFLTINIFRNQELRSLISTKVRMDHELDTLSLSISNQLHRPQTELAGVLAENYFRNFLPSFLFIHGDGEPRHNPAGIGEFFWVDFFFLIAGVVYLYSFDKRLFALFSGWALISPIPTSLIGEPHALRSSLLFAPIMILTGAGLWKLWEMRYRAAAPIIFTLLISTFFLEFIFFADGFYFLAPKKNSRFWSYTAKKASILASEKRQDYDFVILSNDIDNMEFAYPVYTKIDPKLVIEQNRNPAKIDEYSFFKYGNVYIGSVPHTRTMQFIKSLPGSVLYIGSDKEQSYLENYEVKRGFDNSPELIITTKNK